MLTTLDQAHLIWRSRTTPFVSPCHPVGQSVVPSDFFVQALLPFSFACKPPVVYLRTNAIRSFELVRIAVFLFAPMGRSCMQALILRGLRAAIFSLPPLRRLEPKRSRSAARHPSISAMGAGIVEPESCYLFFLIASIGAVRSPTTALKSRQRRIVPVVPDPVFQFPLRLSYFLLLARTPMTRKPQVEAHRSCIRTDCRVRRAR